MEIPARLYFSFWALIGFTFLFLGFNTSNKTGLSDSVSPVVMSLFGHSLAISIFHSSYYALFLRPLPNSPPFLRRFICMYLWLSVVVCTSSISMSLVFSHNNSLPYFLAFLCIHLSRQVILEYFRMWIDVNLNNIIPIVAGSLRFFDNTLIGLNFMATYPVYAMLVRSKIPLDYSKTKLFPSLIVTILQLISQFRVLGVFIKQLDPVVFLMNNKIKFIHFAVGAVVTSLCQYFFKLMSLDYVTVFLNYTTVWLANRYFGSVTYLLVNVLVVCNGDVSRLGVTNWHINGATVFGFALFLIAEHISLKSGQGINYSTMFSPSYHLVQAYPAFTMLVQSQISLDYGKTKLFPSLILSISHLTSLLWALVFHVENQNQLPLRYMNNKMKKLIRFAVGAVVTILFQYFFKFTSFDHVKVFLYYTIVWLANLALLRPSSGDFWIFNFLLGNVIVGCTFNLFGFGGSTWFAYGACVFLYALNLVQESLPLVNRQETQVIVLSWPVQLQRQV